MTDSQKFKLKLQRKNKIKHIIFTTLHIIGYVSTIFMIIIFVLVGCQSCSNNQQKQAQNQSARATQLTQNEVIKLPNNLIDNTGKLILNSRDFVNPYTFDCLVDYIKTYGTLVDSSFHRYRVYLPGKLYGSDYVGAFNYVWFSDNYQGTNVPTNQTLTINNNSSNMYGTPYYCLQYGLNDLSTNQLGVYYGAHSSFSYNGSAYSRNISAVEFNYKVDFVTTRDLIQNYIDNGYSTGGIAPTYNTITLTNTFYPSDYPNRSFTYDVDTQYSTFGDWYNSGTSPLYLIDNSYYGWRGLGEIRYYYSNGWVNVTSNVSLSIQNLELQYYRSIYTDEDLEQSFNEGFIEGKAGYSNSLIMSTYTPFFKYYNGIQVDKYFPNLYYDANLRTYFQNQVIFDDLHFKITGTTIEYDSIVVEYGRLSDFRNNSNTFITSPIAFVKYTDILTNNVNFYDYVAYTTLPTQFLTPKYDTIPTAGYERYDLFYYVKSIIYKNSLTNDSLMVFNGLRNTDNVLLEGSYDSNHDLTLDDSSTPTHAYYFLANGWLSDNYRILNIISTTNELLNTPNNQNNSMTTIDFLLSTFNSGLVSGDVNNVLVLFTTAYHSIADLLNIQVLPHLTLGVLMFIPLIATMVIIIVKTLRHW